MHAAIKHSEPESFRDSRSWAHYQPGVRNSMLRAPGFMQRPLTFITGHAIDGQAPLLRLGPLARSIASFFIAALLAIGIGALIRQNSIIGYLLLIPYWIVFTGILRAFQLVYGHHAIHTAITEDKKIDSLLGALYTIIPLVMNEDDYRRTHLTHHSAKTFCTEDDDDAAFLLELGFRPGMTKKALWRHLMIAPLTPRFHAAFLRARFRSNFLSGPKWRIAASVVWAMMLLSYGWYLGLAPFFLAIVVPFAFLYNFAALLNFMTEHPWMSDDGTGGSRDQYQSKCWGRFCGEPYPPANSGLRQVTWWWVKMFGLHLPVRLFALIGDVTVHDLHHLYSYPPVSADWVYSIFRRQELLAYDTKGMAERELWGIRNTIDSVFEGLSNRRVSK
ncbi:MAG: fatty acid desaturase [Deltaproteobacteria bacterium]|nr:fatty acid desaturase [Deltaproteobacteria bacterium]